MRKADMDREIVRQRCHRTLAALISRDAGFYQRHVHLPRLLTETGWGRLQQKGANSRRIVRALAAAMRRERDLGRARDWRYDLNRHLGLRQALRTELRHWRQQVRQNGHSGKRQ